MNIHRREQLEIESSAINSSWTITFFFTPARVSLTMPILINWFGHSHEEADEQTDE